MKTTLKLVPALFLLAACGQEQGAIDANALQSSEILEASSAVTEPARSPRRVGPSNNTLYRCQSEARRGGQLTVVVEEARGPNRYNVTINRQRGPRSASETRAAIGRDHRRGLDLRLVNRARPAARETLSIRDSRRGNRATGTLTLQTRRGSQEVALNCRATTRSERPTRPSRPGPRR